MIPETINVSFDPKLELPAWARKHDSVCKLAARDLAFRCDVFNATKADWKRYLVRYAERRGDGERGAWRG